MTSQTGRSPSTTTQGEDPQEPVRLQMYGGLWVALVPLALMVGLFIWLSVFGQAGTSTFWTPAVLAIIAGLILARNKYEYSQAIVRGLSDRTGILVIAAFIFAGIFGAIMTAGGLVGGLLWFGLETGITGAAFTLMTFACAMAFAMGVGTSTGTVVALTPVFYPVGFFLGAEPMMLALAIIAGAAFGDNLAPISDTTVVSAYTQEADMRAVVRSRAPLAISAAVVSAAVFAVFGGWGNEVRTPPNVEGTAEPIGLLMLLSFAIVIGAVLLGRHIIESLIWGSLSGIILGIINGQMTWGTVFHIPNESEESTGVIQDGISDVVGPVLFVLLILAIARILMESGVMSAVLAWVQRRAANTVRRGELTAVFSSILFSIPLGANAPAELLVGPTLVKPLGDRFNLAPARKANLMDCAVCTIYYMLPWHNVVIAWYGLLVAAAAKYSIPAPPIFIAVANPYAWALLIVLLVSVLSGWNRRYATA